MQVLSELNPTGHLEIFKVYENGTQEKVFDDHNVIVSGMGVGLAYLFAGSGSGNITDYQIRYFQVGTGGTSSYGVSTYTLNTALTSGQYNTSADMVIEQISQIKNGVTFTNLSHARIPFNHVQRASDTSVKFILAIGRNNVNDLPLPLNEVGLFMANPKGVSPKQTILVAYKKFSDILKTSDFALIFYWTLNFA